MGCGLAMMAASVSSRSKKVDEAHKPELLKHVTELHEYKTILQACISEDSRAYDLFTEAAALTKGSPERAEKMQAALRYAAEVPLKTAQTAHRCRVISGTSAA